MSQESSISMRMRSDQNTQISRNICIAICSGVPGQLVYTEIGVELEMISVILGHSSTETTRIYATPSIEMLGEAMNTANSTIPDETPEWEENEDELARICGLR